MCSCVFVCVCVCVCVCVWVGENHTGLQPGHRDTARESGLTDHNIVSPPSTLGPYVALEKFRFCHLHFMDIRCYYSFLLKSQILFTDTGFFQ